MEQTLTIIKPDAFGANRLGDIINDFLQASFKIRGMKLLRLSVDDAEKFYAVHREREFYDGLVAFMTSGAVAVLVLEKDNAVDDLRQLIGATDPKMAAAGTLRNKYGTSLRNNAVHASDSADSAQRERAFFFNSTELI